MVKILANMVGICLITLVVSQKTVIQMTHLITQSLESTLPLGDKNLVGDGCIYLFAEDAVFCCKALDFC